MTRKDLWTDPFKTLVVMGESTVEGGSWLPNIEDRWADVLARLINRCQSSPVAYHNKGIGANAISPRSPGYANSAKPSAMERYREDVIELNPDHVSGVILQPVVVQEPSVRQRIRLRIEGKDRKVLSCFDGE